MAIPATFSASPNSPCSPCVSDSEADEDEDVTAKEAILAAKAPMALEAARASERPTKRSSPLPLGTNSENVCWKYLKAERFEESNYLS